MQFIPENIENYAISKSRNPSNECEQIAEFTKANIDLPQMLTGPLEMSFMGFLIRALRVQRILEIGTFTGYSALAMAENLPENGSVITLDINDKTAQVAKKFWGESLHGTKITQILGPALESMQKLDGKFDLVFIDADKENYLNYLKHSLQLLNKNGVIVIDNVLWSGRVLDQETEDTSTLAIQKVNDFVSQSDDLYMTMLPVRDGIYLVQKLNIS